MIRNILVTFMLLTASSFSQEIKLDIEDKSYGVKDNVFVKVTGDLLKLALIEGELFYYSERYGVVKVRKIEYYTGDDR